MDLMLLRVFQQQVLLQCQFMLMAAQDVNETLKNGDTRRTFYAIQNLLNAAANISKAFWGQGGRLTVKRQLLRDSIGVSESSPLREITSNTLMNALINGGANRYVTIMLTSILARRLQLEV